jgi:hypothetical protein
MGGGEGQARGFFFVAAAPSGGQSCFVASSLKSTIILTLTLTLTLGSSDSNYALQSASAICKRFGIGTDQFVIGSVVGQDLNNPLCTSFTAP